MLFCRIKLATTASFAHLQLCARGHCTNAKQSVVVGTPFTITKRFTAEEVSSFLNITGDSNPLHTSTAAAAARGFAGGRPVLPGILLATLFPAIIGSRFPGAVYASQSLAFRAPAQVGDEVVATVTVSKASGSRVAFSTRVELGAVGGPVLVSGDALALLQPLQVQGGSGAAPE